MRQECSAQERQILKGKTNRPSIAMESEDITKLAAQQSVQTLWLAACSQISRRDRKVHTRDSFTMQTLEKATRAKSTEARNRSSKAQQGERWGVENGVAYKPIFRLESDDTMHAPSQPLQLAKRRSCETTKQVFPPSKEGIRDMVSLRRLKRSNGEYIRRSNTESAKCYSRILEALCLLHIQVED
jgi:hypothetical protein